MKFFTAAALFAGAAVAAPAAGICGEAAAITNYDTTSSVAGLDALSFTLGTEELTTKCSASGIRDIPSQVFDCDNNKYNFFIKPLDSGFDVNSPQYNVVISKAIAPGVGLQSTVNVPVYCRTYNNGENISCHQVGGTFDFPLKCLGQ